MVLSSICSRVMFLNLIFFSLASSISEKEEQNGNVTNNLFEFWLHDYEIEDLFQATQSYDGSL